MNWTQAFSAADAGERSASGASDPAGIALRGAGPDDGATLARLAALDDAPALQGRALIAFVDDEAVAALSLSDGRVVADPFVLTRDAIALLRLRAAHLAGADRGGAGRLRLRLIPRRAWS